MRKILIADDEHKIVMTLEYTFRKNGYEVFIARDGSEVLELLKEEIPDVILLDVMMPGQDGMSILQQLRSQSYTRDLPVVMATARGTEIDKVQSLDFGADDYLVKPFGMMEMISRIKAVLRRSQRNQPLDLCYFGDIQMDVERHKVSVRKRKVELTLKEFELLHMLLKAPQKVFSRQELLDRVWGQDFLGETRTVDVHVGTLRQKLGSAGGYIKTVRGVGYQLEEEDD